MSKDGNKIGVVLMNLGGPTAEENVRIFLKNLFSDKDIIDLGGGKRQKLLAATISKFRWKGVAEKYKEINGCPKGCTGSKYCLNRQEKTVSDCCSPINGLTEMQRRSLEKKLNKDWEGFDVKVYTAMRYWLPFDYDIFQEAMDDDIDHLILTPLYPQFSYTTTGSSLRNWEDIRKENESKGKKAPWTEYTIGHYHLNEHFLKAVNERIDQAIEEKFTPEQRQKLHILFTAHGTPLSEVAKGDPYTVQIKESVDAIMAMRKHKETHWLGFQSRVGPAKWTQPNTEALIFRLLEYGIKNLLLVPIAFVTDHIETLHELGIELEEALEEKGYDYENISTTKGLNDHPLFLEALKEEIGIRISHVLGDTQKNSKKDQQFSGITS